MRYERHDCLACWAQGFVEKPAPGEMRRLRESVGLSGAFVAGELGVSRQYLSMIERGERDCPQEVLRYYYVLEQSHGEVPPPVEELEKVVPSSKGRAGYVELVVGKVKVDLAPDSARELSDVLCVSADQAEWLDPDAGDPAG